MHKLNLVFILFQDQWLNSLNFDDVTLTSRTDVFFGLKDMTSSILSFYYLPTKKVCNPLDLLEIFTWEKTIGYCF